MGSERPDENCPRPATATTTAVRVSDGHGTPVTLDGPSVSDIARPGGAVRTRAAGCLAAVAVALAAPPARAFWLLGFSQAETQPQGTAGFIGGTGGQLTVIDGQVSFTAFLAHAGLRVGLLDDLDAGYRLTTVALPYNEGGPTLGSQVDLKLRLTPTGSAWRVAAGADMAYAYLDLAGAQEIAWSPGGYALLTHTLGRKVDGSLEARYTYTVVPHAAAPQAVLHAFGGSAGLEIELGAGAALRPEIGFFDFVGSMVGRPANGWAMQYGAVLSARAW